MSPYISVDTDSDKDGVVDCKDHCPQDIEKIEVGVCGCGVADTDEDSDGTMSCNGTVDKCPTDPQKTEPGFCGCGIVDREVLQP